MYNESFNQAMVVILWLIMFTMLFGFLSIKSLEIGLKEDKLSDDEKLIAESFFMIYYSGDAVQKLSLVIKIGANVISSILFFWMKK